MRVCEQGRAVFWFNDFQKPLCLPWELGQWGQKWGQQEAGVEAYMGEGCGERQVVSGMLKPR